MGRIVKLEDIISFFLFRFVRLNVFSRNVLEIVYFMGGYWIFFMCFFVYILFLFLRKY